MLLVVPIQCPPLTVCECLHSVHCCIGSFSHTSVDGFASLSTCSNTQGEIDSIWQLTVAVARSCLQGTAVWPLCRLVVCHYHLLLVRVGNCDDRKTHTTSYCVEWPG